jgi:apolipoprotein N-acyltransferase
MSRKRWWVVIGLLSAVAVGVHLTWLVVLFGLNMRVPAPVMLVLALFPGAMGWLLPLGFAWLWKDEVREAPPGTEAR